MVGELCPSLPCYTVKRMGSTFLSRNWERDKNQKEKKVGNRFKITELEVKDTFIFFICDVRKTAKMNTQTLPPYQHCQKNILSPKALVFGMELKEGKICIFKGKFLIAFRC